MADDAPQLPIVYRPGPRGALTMLAIGAMFFSLGLYAIIEDSHQLVGPAGAIKHARAPSWLIGWLAAAFGLLLTGVGWLSFQRGLPRLELTAEGIVATGRLGRVRRYAWGDIERVEVKRYERSSPLGDASVETLVLAMKRGGEVGLVVPGSAEEVRKTIERMKAGH